MRTLNEFLTNDIDDIEINDILGNKNNWNFYMFSEELSMEKYVYLIAKTAEFLQLRDQIYSNKFTKQYLNVLNINIGYITSHKPEYVMVCFDGNYISADPLNTRLSSILNQHDGKFYISMRWDTYIDYIKKIVNK